MDALIAMPMTGYFRFLVRRCSSEIRADVFFRDGTRHPALVQGCSLRIGKDCSWLLGTKKRGPLALGCGPSSGQACGSQALHLGFESWQIHSSKTTRESTNT